jgi:hypothetical protein
MTDAQRRKFLQYSAAVGGGLPLVGCGGGTSPSLTEPAAALPGADATAAPKPPVPAPPPPPPAPPPAPAPPAPAPAPVAAGASLGIFAGAMQFTLLSTKTQSKAPYCLGYAFRRGDIPAGSSVGASISGLQVISRTTWPDGSLKFAQLAGVVDVTAGSMLVVRLHRINAPAAGTPLGIADLKKTGVTAEFGAGTLGTASFGATDWDAPFQTWASGPQMSSWIFRKPVGSDAHLVAWLEVRLFAGGAVEVLPWIENGYLQVAGPTNKSATYTFKLGSTERFSAAIDLPHHCRTPLIKGAALSYWLADDPGITPRHDVAYLQATELVPTYGARLAADSGVALGLVTSFTPLAAANLIYDGDAMPSTGYQDPIGLLPQHDVAYLTCDTTASYGAVIRNGYAAGRYPLHYRDEKTQRVLRFVDYPNLTLHNDSRVSDIGSSTKSAYTPKPGGTMSVKWDCGHSPSVGYLAYLLTGRWYFMEQVQFAATLDFLSKGDHPVLRDGIKNLVKPCFGAWQTRSCAWQWRTLVQALTVTPDSDTLLRKEFLASVEANINYFHAVYVAQPNNPFGWIQPGESYDYGFGAPWQQDFVNAAFGYSACLGLPVSATVATKLDAFFRWKARSSIMRLGPKDGFWYVNATPYTIGISPSGGPDYEGGKGPWHASDAVVYATSYAIRPDWFGATEGLLAPDKGEERAYRGNLMTAMAYALRHGVPGAAAAYQRLLQAKNFYKTRQGFDNWPVWSVVPSQIAPAWMSGKPVNEWFEIAGTSGAGGAAIDAFSGMALNERHCELLIAAAGGHLDSSDNRVVSISLMADTPTWVTRLAASSAVAQNVAYYADGKPSSRHTNSSLHFVPQVNRLMMFGARSVYGAAWDLPKVDGFNLDSNTWDAAGTWPDMPGGYGAAQIRATGEVIGTGLSKWSPVTQKWTSLVISSNGDQVRWPVAHDPRRNQVFSLQYGDGQGYGDARIVASVTTVIGGVQTSVRFNASSGLDQFLAEKPSYAGMDYDLINDCFMFYSGQEGAAGRVYVIKPNATATWDISVLTLGAGSVKVATNPGGGVHNRFRYIPALRGFVLLARGSANLYFLRTAA